MNEITIRQPDDWHCHLRDGAYLQRTVSDTSAQFARAIVMPNLVPPVTSQLHVQEYRERIMQHIPAGNAFQPLMTLYLNQDVNIETLRDVAKNKEVVACKLYPAGATTNSAGGVSDLQEIYPLLEVMQELGLLLLIHGESINPSTDIFDRENEFIDQQLVTIIRDFPQLKIVLEHISTKHAVEFIQNQNDHVAATITPHHLLLNRNDLLSGGLKPHYYCLPIIKTRDDQQALIQAAISGNKKFFLGTDSAPHSIHSKQSSCCSAGIYSAHAAIELYATVFEQHNALNKLESFASIFGPEFYGLPINQQSITLHKQPWQVADTLSFGDETLQPLFAGETLQWQIQK